MFKRFLIILAILAGLAAPVHAAGTLPGFSLVPQFDKTGNIAPGCKLYVIEAGTTSTPQNAYQDSALSNALPNPLECDAAGRLPQFYLADGQIKVRLTDKNGVQIFVGDNLLVIGPSSGDGGSGGGGGVDATTVLSTGDVKARYGTGTLSGFVRLNGRTIGSATSGASERANADVQALFEYLWGADSNLTVSGGRGASAAADWSANKTITLPDFRSRALAGLGDMGNSDNDLFDGLAFTRGDATTLGSLLGAAKSTVAQANLPSVNFVVDIPAGQGSHFHQVPVRQAPPTSGGNTISGSDQASYGLASTASATLPAMSGTAASGGSGTALATVSPYVLVTIYCKL